MYDFRAAPAHKVAESDDLLGILKPKTHFLRDNGPIANFVTDNREVIEGSVFVAIKGARTDGHRFVDQAFASGARAALVSTLDGIEHKSGCIVTPDPVGALGYLAATHRRAMRTRIIGLTGSVGKTTTKDILHTILSTTFRTRKSEGNRNSTIGLPAQLLALEEADEWMIAEMGMSTPGEIAKLMDMARPNMGLWLAVQAVHLANFENLDGIARAKAEMVTHLEKDKVMVYNLDDPMVHRYSKEFEGTRITYGLVHPDAGVRARIDAFSGWEGTGFELMIGDQQRQKLWLPLVGRYNVANALAACTAAVAARFPVTELSYALRQVSAPEGRSNLHKFKGDIQLVDDTYNANPYAVQQVMRSFAPLSPTYYRWLILGDMLELGPEEAQIHHRIGQEIAGYGFDRVTLVGPLSRHTYDGVNAAQRGPEILEHFEDAHQATQNMNLDIKTPARIWCKASRGIRLEQVTQKLVNQWKHSR